MNLEDIRSMGIVAARKLKPEDVLRAVYEGETYQANDYRIEDKHHNAIDQGWEVRNSYDGNLVSRYRIRWTYHEPAKEGRVRDIETHDNALARSVSHDEKGQVIGTASWLAEFETGRVIGPGE